MISSRIWDVKALIGGLFPNEHPGMGVFWERLIGLTMQAIRKTLGRTYISLQQLQTLVAEIESMLNDRPLT